jgi:hypothetical protein
LRSSDLYRAPERVFGFDRLAFSHLGRARNSVKLGSELAFAGSFGPAEGITHNIQRLVAMPNRSQLFREFSKEPRDRKP